MVTGTSKLRKLLPLVVCLLLQAMELNSVALPICLVELSLMLQLI